MSVLKFIVTFAEMRAHLGMEMQRQWSGQATARSMPVLMDLFSIVTLPAHKLHQQEKLQISSIAWYKKQTPPFSEAIACGRQYPMVGK